MKDVKKTLAKLPRKFASLIKGYKYDWQGGNTMKGDDGHVGMIEDNKKKITIAAPWRYGREHTILHELGHRVWEKFVTPKQKKQWGRIVKATKDKQKDTDEELFCHAFAATYCDNPVEIHHHDEWVKFVKSIS